MYTIYKIVYYLIAVIGLENLEAIFNFYPSIAQHLSSDCRIRILNPLVQCVCVRDNTFYKQTKNQLLWYFGSPTFSMVRLSLFFFMDFYLFFCSTFNITYFACIISILFWFYVRFANIEKKKLLLYRESGWVKVWDHFDQRLEKSSSRKSHVFTKPMRCCLKLKITHGWNSFHGKGYSLSISI